jgi:putative endonuclease
MVAVVYYAYILRCADDSLYVGSAQDLDSRVKAHNDGRGAAHTFKHRPVQLVYSEAFESETAAVSKGSKGVKSFVDCQTADLRIGLGTVRS